MDLQKMTMTVTVSAVVGAAGGISGNQIIDNITNGPAKRQESQLEQIRKVVREEVRSALEEAWPKTSGPVKGLRLIVPNANK